MSKFKPAKDRSNIEDRRGDNPEIPPGKPGGMFYGIAISPHEQELKAAAQARRAAYEAGIMPIPQQPPLIPGTAGPRADPGPGDPWGIEGYRRARADREVLSDLDKAIFEAAKAARERYRRTPSQTDRYRDPK